MPRNNEPDRKDVEFVLPEGILTFMSLFPGQAQDSQTAGNKTYKCEWGGPLGQDEAVRRAVWTVAQFHDPNNANEHYADAFRTIEQMRGRDRSLYPYYVGTGRIVLGLSMVVSPKSLKLTNLNLTDPADRMKYDTAVNAAAPGAVRFANPSDPADVAILEQMSRDNMLKGVPAIMPADYHRTMIRLQPHEIWPGCFGRVAGRAYWHATRKAVHLSLESAVCMTRTGERVGGGAQAPDAIYGAFAPPADLAPPPKQANIPPLPPTGTTGWGGLFG